LQCDEESVPVLCAMGHVASLDDTSVNSAATNKSSHSVRRRDVIRPMDEEDLLSAVNPQDSLVEGSVTM